MSLSSWLATMQEEFLIAQVALISPRTELVTNLPIVGGKDVAEMLQGRKLLKYLTQAQVGSYSNGTSAPVYTTSTPMPVEDLSDCLHLPKAGIARPYALLLEPSEIVALKGPHWVSQGTGIEFLLPGGFPSSAIVGVGEIRVR